MTVFDWEVVMVGPEDPLGESRSWNWGSPLPVARAQKRLVGDRHLLLQLSLWLPTGSKDLTKGDTVGTHQRLNRRRYQRIGKLFLIQ